jgi:WD40 repeat protein
VDTAIFSHDGRTLATAGVDGTVLLWDTASHQRVGQPIGPIAANSRPGIAFSADDRTLRTVSCDAGQDEEKCVTARLWDTTSGQQTRTPNVITRQAQTSYPLWVLSPDGRSLATGDSTHCTAWDLEGGQKTDLAEDANSVGEVAAFSSDAHSAICGRVTTVWVADTLSGRTIAHFALGGRSTIERLALSPDNRTFAAARSDNTVQLWDIASGQQTGSNLTGLTKSATALVFSPDGRALAAAGGDGTALVWDTASQRRFGDPLTAANAIAFSPDDQTLVTGGLDHIIRLWTLPPR